MPHNIIHLPNRFKHCDEIVTMTESIGFTPAPVVSATADLSINDIDNMSGDELLKYHLPDPRFLNADKVFMWDDGEHFHKIEQMCRNVIDDAIKEVSDDLFNNPNWMDNYGLEYISVIRYKVGGFFGVHADSTVQPNNKFRSVTVVVYLSDFEGGDVHFPKQDVTVSPNKGDVVIFPSGEEYRHRSTVITSGTKYAFTLWPIVDERLTISNTQSQ